MTIGKLVGVAASGDLRLSLSWDDGTRGEVDLRDLATSRSGLQPLLNAALFGSVGLAADGWSIEWPAAGIDFGSAQLRRWADEQAGEAMPAVLFRSWVERHKLDTESAARALGLSPSAVAAYLSGEMPIPKTVMLATEGFNGRQAA
jgi:hypothetical protein